MRGFFAALKNDKLRQKGATEILSFAQRFCASLRDSALRSEILRFAQRFCASLRMTAICGWGSGWEGVG
jgi:hypothetical protein